MLTPDAIRNELIRQLNAGTIQPKDVAKALSLPSSRVAEMRARTRRVQPTEMEPLAALLKMIDGSGGITTRESSPDIVMVQKLDLSLSMGPGTIIDDWVEAEPISFDRLFLQSITRAPAHRLKLVSGIGDSMYPTLNWGDAIMIDTTDRALARQDGIYWVSYFGASGIKRLRTIAEGRILVKSDNPNVGDQEVNAEDLRIEGRAIWVARSL